MDDNYGLSYTPSFAEPSYDFSNSGDIGTPEFGASVVDQDAIDALTPPDLTRYDTPAFGQSTYDFSGNEPSVRGSEFGAPSGSSTIDEVLGSGDFWSGIVDTLKSVGTGILKDPAKLASAINAALAGRALFDKSFGTAPQGGYSGPGINMNLKATRGPISMPQRAAYAPEGASGHDYGVSNVTYAAQGGIMDLARGGRAKREPRYLDGSTDGMADKINTSIDDAQPAKLSHGEFVIPADVVSHLGNGNSSAGAKVLYAMMAKVRKARTGSKKQGKQINPAKFTPGGIAAYAGGGAVAFNAGGAALTEASNLSTWAGPYVVDMLSKTKALTDVPTPVYTGTLSAGPSAVQTTAFNAAKNLQPYQTTTFQNQFTAPTAYTPGTFNNSFTAPDAYQTTEFDTGLGQVQSVEDYMSPYMQNVVDVQAAAARRAADIARVADAQRMTRAGGYGGSRQAIMESEGTRNLQTLLNEIQAKGSQSAYEQAVTRRMAESEASMNAQRARELSKQFGAGQGMTAAQAAAQYGLGAQELGEKSRQFGATQGMTAADLFAKYGLAAQEGSEMSKQFGAKYGLDSIQTQLAAGAAQRAIEQQAVDAQRAQFEAQAADPYKRLQFQQSMLKDLPIGTSTTSANYSGLENVTNLSNQIVAGLKSAGVI